MSEDIFIESQSPNARYYCIIESDQNSVWMYLHDAKNKSVIADSPICSLTRLMSLSEFKSSYKGEVAPPLVVDYSTDNAVIADISSDRLEILWLTDGVSPLAVLDNAPFSLIIKGQKKGYSKAIKVDGPWGHPWDNDLYLNISAG
jgi:hypothetical protein